MSRRRTDLEVVTECLERITVSVMLALGLVASLCMILAACHA